jgi:nucleotide-binding universal stress UspA family protein
MHRILVPTDFSECAEMAVEAAASIARKTNSRLYLMHIVHIPSYESNTSLESFQDFAEGIFIMKLVKKKFAELLAKPFLSDVNVIELIQFDSVYESISKQAKDNEIDLIVMGSHGTSGAKELLIGSNTERIIRTSVIPVLTIKSRHQDFNPQNIIFASNFYGESDKNFSRIHAIANIFGAKIHLLKVNTPNNFETTRYSEQLIAEFAKRTGIQNYTSNIYNDEKVEDGIHHFSERVNADLIAMETHGRTGIAHLLTGSITEGVANHSKLPVLSVKIEKEVRSREVIFPD